MATNLELIRDSLGMLGILNEIEQASAEQGQHGLRMLNQMLEEWAADGISIGQWPQKDINAEFPGPDGALLAVKYSLAIALGPYYGVTLNAPDTQRAERYYGRLIRDTVKANLVPADLSDLPTGVGSGGGFNILTG